MPFLLFAALAAAFAAFPAPALGQLPEPPSWRLDAPAPQDDIVLLTMGPDHDVLFREWGHAALCVGENCFNYGVTDFSRPARLLIDVFRGQALFWVAVTPYESTLATYFAHDRSVFRQDLELTPEARSELLGRLAADLVPGASEYLYDHFDDNCTTRVRDYLDEAAGGALQAPVSLPSAFAGRGDEGSSFRTHIRRGLTTRPFLLWVTDIGVGSAVDRPINDFEAMFLPGGLRAGVEAAFDAPPLELRSGRDGALLPPDPGSAPYVPWLLLVGTGLALVILRGGRPGRAAAALTGGAAALLGAIGLGLLLGSPLPEFHSSLLFLAAPATDLLLVTRWSRFYAPLRLAFGLGFLAVLVVGPFPQPLEWTVFALLLPIGAIWWRGRRADAATASIGGTT